MVPTIIKKNNDSTKEKTFNKKSLKMTPLSSSTSYIKPRNLTLQFQKISNQNIIQKQKSYKNNLSPIKGINQSNSKDYLNEKQNISLNIPTIPKSYLIAMSILQCSLEEHKLQISNLQKQLVMQQQNRIIDEQRVTKILSQFGYLKESLDDSNIEVRRLKVEIEQLKKDKQNLIKIVAQKLSIQSKQPKDQLEIRDKKRQMQIIIEKQRLDQLEQQAIIKNKELIELNASKAYRNRSQTVLKKPTQQQIAKTPNLQQCQIIGQDNQRKYLSKLREIIRHEKQMVTLVYQMQNLEKRINQQKGQYLPQTKEQYARLKQQIQRKQMILKQLKNIVQNS